MIFTFESEHNVLMLRKLHNILRFVFASILGLVYKIIVNYL